MIWPAYTFRRGKCVCVPTSVSQWVYNTRPRKSRISPDRKLHGVFCLPRICFPGHKPSPFSNWVEDSRCTCRQKHESKRIVASLWLQVSRRHSHLFKWIYACWTPLLDLVRTLGFCMDTLTCVQHPIFPPGLVVKGAPGFPGSSWSAATSEFCSPVSNHRPIPDTKFSIWLSLIGRMWHKL